MLVNVGIRLLVKERERYNADCDHIAGISQVAQAASTVRK